MILPFLDRTDNPYIGDYNRLAIEYRKKYGSS